MANHSVSSNNNVTHILYGEPDRHQCGRCPNLGCTTINRFVLGRMYDLRSDLSWSKLNPILCINKFYRFVYTNFIGLLVFRVNKTTEYDHVQKPYFSIFF